jgi:hypothetical protein
MDFINVSNKILKVGVLGTTIAIVVFLIMARDRLGPLQCLECGIDTANKNWPTSKGWPKLPCLETCA